jgi:hypothetical protein
MVAVFASFETPLDKVALRCRRVQNIALKLSTSPSGRASGDGRDYGELIALRDLGVGTVEVSDVLVALVHVDERAELAVAGVQVLLEVRMFLDEVPQSLACGLAADLYLRITVRKLS